MEEPKIFRVEDEEGNEIEAVNKSELDALRTTIEEQNTRLEELQRKSEGESDKDKNFGALRKAKEKIESDKADLESRLAGLEEALKVDKDRASTALTAHKNAVITRIANGDKEKQEKIEYYYNRFGGDAYSIEDIEQRIQDAVVLASKNKQTLDPINQAMGASGYSGYSSGSGAEKKSFADTPEGQAMAKRMKLKISE